MSDTGSTPPAGGGSTWGWSSRIVGLMVVGAGCAIVAMVRHDQRTLMAAFWPWGLGYLLMIPAVAIIVGRRSPPGNGPLALGVQAAGLAPWCIEIAAWDLVSSFEGQAWMFAFIAGWGLIAYLLTMFAWSGGAMRAVTTAYLWASGAIALGAVALDIYFA